MTNASSAAGAGAGASARASTGAGSRRRELAALLLTGAAGSGLVLLALRQEWARVTTLAPRPLPTTVVVLTGQNLVPAAAALAVAALASLAAVLATRRLPRRITGLISAGLGAWIAVLVAGRISAAGVLAAARGAGPPAGGSGAGTAAGSVTAGGAGGAGGTGRPLTGFPAHVLLTATGWRGVVLAGALAVVAAGLVIMLRADRLPVMSGRYDRPVRAAGTDRVTARTTAAGSARTRPPGDTASMWDALSAGGDPTAAPGRDGG
jgi:uncharacterized membrane protein (TIGR02234 family)